MISGVYVNAVQAGDVRRIEGLAPPPTDGPFVLKPVHHRVETK